MWYYGCYHMISVWWTQEFEKILKFIGYLHMIDVFITWLKVTISFNIMVYYKIIMRWLELM